MLLESATDWKPKQMDWLIPNILCDSLTLISGEPKMGKTLFAANLVRGLINQSEVLGQLPKEGEFRIAWMGFDLGWQQEFINSFKDIHNNVWFCPPLNYKNLNEWRDLQSDSRMIKINLLVVDHLHGLAPAIDLNYAHNVDEAFLPIQEFINSTGIPVLLIHHANKTGTGRAANSALIEAKARLLGRISGGQGKKNKTIEFVGNQIETFKVSASIKPEGIQMLESKKSDSKKSLREDEGVLISQAKFFIENAPIEAKLSARAAGKWLASRGMSKTDGAGRTKINNMLSGGLLIRLSESGPLTPGHKLLY